MINKRDYKFYVLVFDKIDSGWEYRSDASDHVADLPDPRSGKVYAKRTLITMGVDPDKNASWHGGNYGGEHARVQRIAAGNAERHESGKNPAVKKEAGPYSDPSAAHERSLKLQSAGAKNIFIKKTSRGWMIHYVEYVSASKHESGKNPLTIGERAKLKLKVLSPEAARVATNREKALLREHGDAVLKLKDGIEACKRCERGAEKKAAKHLKEAKKSLESLERLAHYRSGPEIAAANIKRFRAELGRAEGILHGEVKKASASGGGESAPRSKRVHEGEDVEESGPRTLRSGALTKRFREGHEKAAKHEAGDNPRTLQNILLQRKVRSLVGRGGR